MAFTKDPDATLDYTFDWKASSNGTGSSDWLESGESISTATVTVPSGLTKDSQAVGSGAVTVWISGGTAGESYKVLCQITTDNSPARTDERSIIINVKER